MTRDAITLRFPLVAFLLGTLMLSVCSGAQDPSPRSVKLFQRATRFLYHKQYDRAEPLYLEVIETWTKEHGKHSSLTGQATLALAWCRFKGRKLILAIEAAEQALAIADAQGPAGATGRAECLRALARFSEEAGHWRSAATHYERAIECLGRERPHSLETLADTLERYASLLRRLPPSDSWFGLSGGANEMKQRERAAEAFEDRARRLHLTIAKRRGKKVPQ